MSLPGHDFMGLLDDLHGTNCDGTEYSACRPVPNLTKLIKKDPDEPNFHVVYMAWCSECGAADYEIV